MSVPMICAGAASDGTWEATADLHFGPARVSNVGARRGQSGQRISYDPFEVHLWHPELARLGQDATNLAFSKAQAT
ncbi:MAG TPA: hypothetical protein VH062_01180 [Polyangiaceae bacterium]|nr:hypothetical protein [Polyangiaceae bacterium]